MAQSIFITIPKKSKALECSNFRTISLMSHVMKALKIILDCNEKKLEAEMYEKKSGFRHGKVTREEKHFELPEALVLSFYLRL